MNPEKSKRKSRRSSILKPPKPRQPFQNVELAVSSAENSPTTITTKVKRRVSFAEKKHVKEFCDSMEQGTVWDNTYEESELSQMRNTGNSSITKSLSPENNKDSRSIEREINSGDLISELAHTKPLGIPLSANPSGSLHACHSLSAIETAFGRSSNSEKPFLLECPDSYSAKVSATTSTTELKEFANIVPPTMQDDDCNNISMDETLIENISVESTIPTPITLSKTAPILHTSVNVITNIDFLKTGSISSIGPLRRVSETPKDTIGPMELNDCQTIRTKAQCEIVVYQDTSMEMTEAMSNRFSIISKHQSKILSDRESNEDPFKTVAEQKTTFQIKTVDTVTKILGLAKKDFKELDQNSVDLRPERMPIFHNKSIQSRNVAQNILSTSQLKELPAAKPKIFHSEPVDLTKVVQNVQRFAKPETIETRQTTDIHDESLEKTEAIQNDLSICQLQKIPSEKTTIYPDKSVDFTGNVQTLPFIEEPQQISLDQTTLFHNKSLNFTEVVRSSDSDENLQISSQKFPTKTDLQDQSMDIIGVKRYNSSIQSPEKAAPEKTMIFQNQLVDMTEVVRDHQNHGMQQSEKTTIFHNQSVDMTEVVRSHQIYEKPLPEKTTIFHNQSVDMTEVVRSCQSYEKSPTEKTTIFENQAVGITEDVGSHRSYEKPPLEKTTISPDRSINITKPVRNRPSCEKSNSAKTTLFQNQSVDMIEVFRSNPIVGDALHPDKIATYPDNSIGTTEIIPNVCSQNPIQKVFDLEVLPSWWQGTTVLNNTPTGHNNVETVDENEPSENVHLVLTEAISRVPSDSKLLSRDSCTLAKERISKQKPLNSEDANELIACIDVKAADPDVRSPVTKRMKSLGCRQSLDLTAAVPFVMYRKLAHQRRGDIQSITCNPSCAHVYCETASTVEGCNNISMNVIKVPAGSTIVDPFRMFPVRAVNPVTQEARNATTDLQSRLIEMTEAIPSHYSLKSTTPQHSTGDADWQRQPNNTICHDDSMEITRAIPGILKVNAAMYHNDSMEFTKPVPHHPITENLTVLNRNHGSSNALPTSESETIVFRVESMELTSGICLSLQPIKRWRTNVEEFENPCPNVIAEIEKDGRTMVYRDDSMELTRAVLSPLHARTQDKENCPPGSRKKGSLGISKNEWLEIMKSVSFESSQDNEENNAENACSQMQNRNTGSEEITGTVPFLSSQKNKESEVEAIASKKQRLHTNSDDITGVVAFGAAFETEKSDQCILKEVGSAKGSGVKEMEMTEGIRWSSGLNLEKPVNVVDNVDRELGLPSIEVFSPPDKIQHRHSQVAKELFQKPVPINSSKATNKNPTTTSETPDLNAAIRKRTFAFSNSVDESGFDQATFLRQQARCMEDYEANSTAGQESYLGTMSTENKMSIVEKRDPTDQKKSISPTVTVANQNLTLPTENRVISPDSKTADISIHNHYNSQCNSPLRMNREDYDRSLEELRCRAYSVSKLRPEVTGFELTGAISIIIDSGNLHKSIFDEEPPSYVFTDSVTTNAITDCSALADVSTTESDHPIGGRGIQGRNSLEMCDLSVSGIAECVKPLRNDTPQVETISVAEEKITLEEDNYSADVLKNEIVERVGGPQRSQTFVIKRPSTDPTILISSSTETEIDLQRERLSGLTTATEFSSESSDGPNEKIRRRECRSTTDERILPTVDKVRSETEFIEIGRSWGTKTFASSTVIGEDYTRQFVLERIEDTSIVLDRASSNELLSEIVYDDDPIVNKEADVEKAIGITMKLDDRVPKSPYAVIKETIESLAARPETVWKIKRLDEQIVAFTFFSRSLVVAIYLNDNAIWDSTNPIKEIGFLSQLKEDGSPPNICLAHRMIMKKICSASLTESYNTYEDIPRMLEYVTAEVKLGMDFMFELDRLSDRMIMDINSNSITFTVRTRNVNAGIILNITMEIKPFEEISPDDITVAYLLGREEISENYIKRLITNVKRDHRFLRVYINDVRAYIELIAESGFSIKKKTK